MNRFLVGAGLLVLSCRGAETSYRAMELCEFSHAASYAFQGSITSTSPHASIGALSVVSAKFTSTKVLWGTLPSADLILPEFCTGLVGKADSVFTSGVFQGQEDIRGCFQLKDSTYVFLQSTQSWPAATFTADLTASLSDPCLPLDAGLIPDGDAGP